MLILAIMLCNSLLAQNVCTIKDRVSGNEVTSSTKMEFTFGDTFNDVFEVSGSFDGQALTPEDFILMVYSAGNELKGSYSLDDPVRFETGLNYNLRLLNTADGKDYPADGAFRIHLNKRQLSINGNGYFEAIKPWDGTVDVKVDLAYANENLLNAVGADNIKVEFQAEYSNPDADNDVPKTIFFTNIKVTGNNVEGYEFSLENKQGYILKNTEMSENIYWRLDGKNKKPSESVSMYYGKTVGTGGNLYSQIDNVTGYASYYAFPSYEILNMETGTIIKISSQDDPYMIPIGLYRVKAIFEPISHKESFGTIIDERKLIVSQNKLKIIAPSSSEFTYGDSELGSDIKFKAQTQDNSVLPGTWRYLNILDSTWYEQGQMLDSGSYKFKAFFTAANPNFGVDSSTTAADIIVYKRALRVRVPGPFVQSDKYYDTTTTVFGIDLDKANSLDVLSGFATVDGKKDGLEDVFITKINAEYVGPDCFTPDQGIKIHFELGGPKAFNYKIIDIPNYPGQIKPLPILVKLNGGEFNYGNANLYEGDLEPYFVYADDPTEIVTYPVESEPGSRWYFKSNTVSPLVGAVPDGYYNTGIKPLHLDAVTHKITAFWQTGDQTNYEVRNNILLDDGSVTTLDGYDETTIKVNPVRLNVEYKPGKIMKFVDGNVSVIPANPILEYAHGTNYRYEEDSTVFVVNGFIDITQDENEGSHFDSPELGKRDVCMYWTLDHGTRIAENYWAKQCYESKGRIVKSTDPATGEGFYDIVWNYQDDTYFDQYDDEITVPYGTTIGTVRPCVEPRQNYDLWSEFEKRFADKPSKLDSIPTYEYSETNGNFKPYTDGTILPVGTYWFRATFNSTDPDIDNIAIIKVKITPLSITPVVVYDREKFYDGTIKVNATDSYLSGLLDKDKDEFVVDYEISYSDFNSGERDIQISYTVQGDLDVLKNYTLSKTSEVDPNGLIKPIQSQVVWLYDGELVTVDTLKLDPELDGCVFKKDIIANLDLGEFSKFFDEYTGPKYTVLEGAVPADNVLPTGVYKFNAQYTGDDVMMHGDPSFTDFNFISSNADLIVEVLKLKIRLIEQHTNRQDDGIFPYGSRIGKEIKMIAENDQSPKSKIVYYYYMEDYEYPTEPLPADYKPAPGKHTLICEAIDRNNYMLSSRKTIEIEIGPNPVHIVGDLKVQVEKVYDGSDTAHVISNDFVIDNIGEDDVVLDVKAKYDTPESGINKVITYTLSISGKDSNKYMVPQEYVNHVYKTDGDELGVITPLPIKLTVEDKVLTYGESVLGKDFAAVMTPDGIAGSLLYDIKEAGQDLKGGNMLKVGEYMIRAKFIPESNNYKGFVTEYVKVTVNQKKIYLDGDLVIKPRYEDKTTVIYDNQYESKPVLGAGVLDGDVVSLDDSYPVEYPVEVAGNGYVIVKYYSLIGDDAYNYNLSPKRIETTADILKFQLPDPDPVDPSDPTDPNDPNNPGSGTGDPNVPGSGNDDKPDPNDPANPGVPNGSKDGDYEVYTYTYGPNSVLSWELIMRKFDGLILKCMLDGQDQIGKMLVPQDDPYLVDFEIYQNTFLLSTVKTKIYILKRHLHTTALNFPHEKVWDGTTRPTTWDVPRLTNVVAGDELGGGSGVNVNCESADINFNNPNVGTGKNIRAHFVIGGNNWEARYYAPDDVNYNDGVITKANIGINLSVDPNGYCAGDKMNVEFTYTCPGSQPLCYTIDFDGKDAELGFLNIDDVFANGEKNQTVVVPVPAGLSYDNHSANVRFFYAVGNEVQAEGTTSLNFLTNYSNSLIHDKFQDVVLIDNSSFKFKAYEWYKDDKMLADETKQFFNDKPYLFGWYGAYVTTVNDERIKVCPVHYDNRPAASKKAEKTVGVYPNPAFRMETVTIDLSDFEDEDLSNAEIIIYNSVGVMAQKINDVKLKNFVNLPTDNYTGKVILGDKNLSFKLIVRD